jgi:hypothetical protein
MVFVAIAVSLGGIGLAVHLDDASHGGRGGALAVALTFFLLFMDRGTATKVLQAQLPGTNGGDGAAGDEAELTKVEKAVKDLEMELVKVRGAVAATLDWNRKERKYLIVSSVFGTLVWGFGDWVAACLGAS